MLSQHLGFPLCLKGECGPADMWSFGLKPKETGDGAAAFGQIPSCLPMGQSGAEVLSLVADSSWPGDKWRGKLYSFLSVLRQGVRALPCALFCSFPDHASSHRIPSINTD